ncbi:hypothetical protein PHSY_003228 [Pseudozyma hubeiensis SY62]|uniref:Uncharacterized protein n=1 Tax=Pseudozyma hubeiensis (strain SY62) TaxID=1305764 RepID=R9P320_PSEHS|nr:hypothetical protein PHSY_003228 [Pseudozyma hubeiensis SY62]GAC95652.1 hypothetical protein PHSY_003228 [Pseudozyma hubeiensis SY62]
MTVLTAVNDNSDNGRRPKRRKELIVVAGGPEPRNRFTSMSIRSDERRIRACSAPVLAKRRGSDLSDASPRQQRHCPFVVDACKLRASSEDVNRKKDKRKKEKRYTNLTIDRVDSCAAAEHARA